jgi:hypothetical protein
MTRLTVLLPGLMCAVQLRALAYDIPNHFDMAQEAVSKSVLVSDPEVLPNLGLSNLEQLFKTTTGAPSTDFTDGCAHSTAFTIGTLVACGAEFEDVPGTRSLNHFFDPVNNIPLTVLGIQLGLSSPDWSLKDNNNESSQLFSYRDARNSFYNALTSAASPSDRGEHWGKMFQSLGQTIHHVQDMAQPQHVRNDQHVDKKIPGFYNPSLYETYTRDSRRLLRALISRPDIKPVFTTTEPGIFRKPRDFWTNAAKVGLADMTNGEFLSAGTNFQVRQGAQQIVAGSYALPAPGEAETVAAKDLSPPLSPQILAMCGAQGFDCKMTFYSTAAGRPRAATRSIFDQHLQLRPVTYRRGVSTYQVDRLFTLNRYNYDVAHQTLIPRAVAYSAGLLNFFFRGKMEISLPEEGVYGVIDHTIENAKDTAGFRKIRARIRNVTPRGNGIEPMAAPGKLRAVARFHRNTCYKPDLSGEFGSPGVDWKGCRSKVKDAPDVDVDGAVEEILLSDEVDVGADVNTLSPSTRTFSFATPIPINATDLFLQVVYRGPLGDETDAVVATTRDISEPTFLYKFDIHDQLLYAHYPEVGTGPYTWSDWCGQAVADGAVSNTAECPSRLWPAKRSFQFSPTGDAISSWDPAAPTVPMNQWIAYAQQPALRPVATLFAPTGSVARVAVLTDAAPSHPAIYVDDWNGRNHLFSWTGGAFQPARSQLDISTKTLTPTQTWAPARGIYVSPADAQFIGTPPAGSGSLTPSPSAIDFPSAPVSP